MAVFSSIMLSRIHYLWKFHIDVSLDFGRITHAKALISILSRLVSMVQIFSHLMVTTHSIYQ